MTCHTYLSDERVIVNLYNLRWIKKESRTWSGRTDYTLTFSYNTRVQPDVTVTYDNERKRDAFFDLVSDRLNAQKM